ncbi:MAG: 16S rRNA (adenine1518-N6/adenine1519-N6)-dimethyltransferase [Candidatus Berkelbacteria bacterium Licking1014_2]|uniref:Ribosomal RNA small subunit methyltransferase A n=1 Tax=Candidatus Berkelbacteria bacterium Licking1014_2 TaxID=2017146 RepID=A0A554LSU6_9BACT|nr:MAG: 16S rRNA (adenine1518-N6/adenine1519-N6)-dimethyltransferase [Candidatus Berkelbacteria bacterium Licking1014_2]
MLYKHQKALGQNFLINKAIAAKIVAAGEVEKTDLVLEVGPGKGALTDFLIAASGRVMAVEKDIRLANGLREKYNNQPNVEIIQDDILKFKPTYYLLLTTNYKLISNLPYSITSPFLSKFFISGKIEKPKLAVLMVQKEVAKRLTSLPGEKNRGVLTVLLQSCCQVDYLFTVGRENFQPQPKVDSAVIKIAPRKINLEPSFIAVVKAGFSAKRRKLANSLAGGLGITKASAIAIVQQSGLSVNVRAEDLTTEEWQEVWYNITK